MKKSPIEEKLSKELEVVTSTLGWDVRRGIRYGAFTADFVIAGRGVSVIVETDGFEFHERTREQAEKDRRRDRWFLRVHQMPTLRFLSDDVFRNPLAVVTQIIQVVAALGSRPSSGAEEHW